MSRACESRPAPDAPAVPWGCAPQEPEKTGCQFFRQGCAGCCLNMRRPEKELKRFLERNTRAAERIFAPGRRPGYFRLMLFYLACGGALDYLLAFLLVPPTFALSAVAWRRFFGSCRFAGIIDREKGCVGCLIHPARVGLPDCRKHAFPMLPTVRCDIDAVCPMLRGGAADLSLGWFEASRRGAASMKRMG